MGRITGTMIPRKRKNVPVIIAMNVRDFPIVSSNSIKVVCSGGCGEEVWVNKRLERICSKVPVFCLDCGSTYLETSGVGYAIMTRTCSDVMDIFTDERGVCKIPEKWRELLSERVRSEYLALKATSMYAEGSSFVARARERKFT